MLKIKCAKTFQYLYFNIPPLYKIKQYFKKPCVGYFIILVKVSVLILKDFFLRVIILGVVVYCVFAAMEPFKKNNINAQKIADHCIQ